MYSPNAFISFYLLSDDNIFYLALFISFSQTGKAISSENENTSNRAEECIAERIEIFKSAFGETEEQLNQEKYVIYMYQLQKFYSYLAKRFGSLVRSKKTLRVKKKKSKGQRKKETGDFYEHDIKQTSLSLKKKTKTSLLPHR